MSIFVTYMLGYDENRIMFGIYACGNKEACERQMNAHAYTSGFKQNLIIKKKYFFNHSNYEFFIHPRN